MPNDPLQPPDGTPVEAIRRWACSHLQKEASEAEAARKAVLDSLPTAVGFQGWARGLSVVINGGDQRVLLSGKTEAGWHVAHCADTDPECQKIARVQNLRLFPSVLTFDCKDLLYKLPPIDPRPYQLKRGIDGDTIEVTRADIPEPLKIRFMLVNTTECGKGGGESEKRCQRGESGAYSAWKFLDKFLTPYGNTVHLRIFGDGGYGRSLATVYVPDGKGGYLDVNRLLVAEGYAHVYIIAPDITGWRDDYLAAQGAARAAGKGIWQYPRYQTTLHFTSFHGCSHRPEGRPKEEYLRIFNIGPAPLNLGGYQLSNGKESWALPDFTLPRGYGVKVTTHHGTTNDDPSEELIINLGTNGASWDKDRPMVLKAPDGRIIDAIATNKRAKNLLPDGF